MIKKSLLSLLSLAMLLPLLAAPSAAAETKGITVQAFRPSEDGQINVDGAADEIYWLLDTPVGDARLGALCDGYGLYLAFETAADTAAFTFTDADSDITVTCTLGDAPATDIGTIAGQNGVYELKLSYTNIDLEHDNLKPSFTAVIGSDSVSGTLVINAGGLKLTGKGKDLTGADYYDSLFATDSTGNITVTEAGEFTIKNDGAQDTYDCTTKSGTGWSSLTLPGLVMAFEADFNDLPVSSTRKYMYNFGLFWFVTDADCRYDMAFWADTEGQIRFTVHQATDAASRSNALATGICLGTEAAQNVRVRVLMDADHNVTLYLNGVKIGTLLAEPSAPATGTLVRGQLHFYAGQKERDSTEHSVNVTLSDLSFKELTAVEPRPVFSYDRTIYLNDDAPVNKGVSGYSSDRLESLDATHNSIVLDQKSSQRFNRIHLFDTDEVSRVSQNDLGVFVSDTGKEGSWTKVTGWQLHQSGSRYTLYNLDETARYIKVHCYLDNLNHASDSTPFAPGSFTNYVSDMIEVEYSPYLLGADSDFAYTGSLTVSNPNETDLYDEPVQIALSEIGALPGEYLASCADFRFTSGSQLLPHWYDGDSSFYVRIPHIPAGGSTTIRAHWSNPEADDVSDRQAVFEAVYGNTSLINLSSKTKLRNSGRAFTFPNGDVIAVGKDSDGALALVRSTDGGRTFTKEVKSLIPNSKFETATVGFGGFLYDEDINRLYLIAYAIRKLDSNYTDNEDTADGRLVLMYTEDYGVEWSEPRPLSSDPDTMQTIRSGYAKYSDNDHIVENYGNRGIYSVTYCDGLKLKDADGKGENVDYVIMHNSHKDIYGSCIAASIYSKDGGETWIASENVIDMNTAAGHEKGISETALAQLDNGTLYIVARAQAEDNYYLYESYSYDGGITWTEAKPSSVFSTNTSPVMLPYGNDRLLMWAGNSSLGTLTRRRLPMTLAISSDNYASYDRSIDLTLGTSFDTLEDAANRMTQPSLSLSPDGSEAFVCWTNLNQTPQITVGMLIEDFGNMIYKTRGAYDGFECSAIKGEGWLLGDRTTSTSGSTYSVQTCGEVIISTDKANSGSRSMKVIDDGTTLSTYVLRQIPSMRTGTVGVSLYVPSGNTTDFVFELKPAYNYSYGKFTTAGFGINSDGNLFLVAGSSAATTEKVSLNKKVSLNAWHDYSIEFDMVGTKKGTLFVDGVSVATFDLFGDYDRITVAELSEYQATDTVGSVIYVDDFYAVEAAQGVTVESGESRLSVSVYKDSGTLPAQDGYVFAGWYYDVDGTRPYIESTGYAYARFVEEKVLSVKMQLSANTTDTTAKTDLRLLTSVDSVNYTLAGFKVTIGNTTQPISSTKVFKRIVANDGGVACYHSPDVFSEQSRYFMTYTITNVPNAAFDTEIEVVPYWVTLDGDEVTGVKRTFTINELIAAPDSSGLSSSTQGSGDSDSFENMFGSSN